VTITQAPTASVAIITTTPEALAGTPVMSVSGRASGGVSIGGAIAIIIAVLLLLAAAAFFVKRKLRPMGTVSIEPGTPGAAPRSSKTSKTAKVTPTAALAPAAAEAAEADMMPLVAPVVNGRRLVEPPVALASGVPIEEEEKKRDADSYETESNTGSTSGAPAPAPAEVKMDVGSLPPLPPSANAMGAALPPIGAIPRPDRPPPSLP